MYELLALGMRDQAVALFNDGNVEAAERVFEQARSSGRCLLPLFLRFRASSSCSSSGRQRARSPDSSKTLFPESIGKDATKIGAFLKKTCLLLRSA